MADFTAAHPQASLLRKRPTAAGGPNLEGTILLDRKTDASILDRAHEYDRALKQSQHAARRRAMGGSILGASVNAPGPSASSIFGGMSGAQTAVLGDSNGSVHAAGTSERARIIPDEDLEIDGGVGSGLGESYVDGAKRSRPYDAQNDEEEEEEDLEDGGVLGLLAQIYGRKEGPRVI